MFSSLMKLQWLIQFGKLFLSNIFNLIYILILIINKNIALKQKMLMVYDLLKCSCSDISARCIKMIYFRFEYNNEGHFALVSLLSKQGEYDYVNIYTVLVKQIIVTTVLSKNKLLLR